MREGKTFVRQLEDEFTIRNIGSTLLHELAKGLYQPEHVVREYVANAVDAHRSWLGVTGKDVEQPVQIELRPNSISILDYGIGMDELEIKDVKSIAVSRKPSSEIRLTGHKGVGIWAGLSFFERIVVYTTKQGVDQGYELTVEFKDIVSGISDDKDIGSVLNANFHINVYDEPAEEHFTTITLEAPTRSEDQFLDPEFVADAVRRICPCEVDPTFAFHDELTAWYKANGIEVFPIEVDGERIYRSYSSNVEDPRLGTITVDDKPVARYWLAINKKNSVLPAQPKQLVGFRLIIDGFVLGGENPYTEPRLQGYELVKVQQYLEWHIAEVHITSEELRPNLKRDMLEESEANRRFIEKLRAWYADVDRSARLTQEKRNRIAKYEEWASDVNAFLQKVSESELTDKELAHVKEIHEELSKQEDKARSYKPKGTYEPKTQALKLVAKERKQLLALMDPLLVLAEKQSAEEDGGDSSEAGSGKDTGSGTGTGKTRSEGDGPETKGTSDDETTAGTDDDSSTQNHEVAVDVVLALFEEVLVEEFPDYQDRVQSAVVKVRQRIEQLLRAKQERSRA